RSGDAGSRCSSSAPGRAGSYEFRRRVWDRVLPTKLRRGAEALHGSAASSVMASNSFSMARTSGSLFAIRHASTKCRSRAESFSLSALARYLERSRAGTLRINCSARSSGSVKVIFRVAILPYYHISHPKNDLHTAGRSRSEEHTSELQSLAYLVCRLLLEKKKKKQNNT